MAGCRLKVSLVLVSIMAVFMPTLRAGIAEFDEYLLQKADEAKQAALEAFHPDPMNVTDHLNHHVHLYVPLFFSPFTFLY